MPQPILKLKKIYNGIRHIRHITRVSREYKSPDDVFAAMKALHALAFNDSLIFAPRRGPSCAASLPRSD